jgi:hypothetical protein
VDSLPKLLSAGHGKFQLTSAESKVLRMQMRFVDFDVQLTVSDNVQLYEKSGLPNTEVRVWS